MINKVIDILTSHDTPKKVCAMGNEAVARGALEAGVNGVFSYPGTPSTEISEIFSYVNDFQMNPAHRDQYSELTANPVYFEYSINEKIALEKAIAYSIGNKSAMCVMKNVGMNVASDPLMSITYQTIIAPVVVVVCDDPGCHSSSNEQDSRYWGQMASVPVFNPATPEEAHQMMKDAFALSDQLKLPVIVRLTTRVSHTRGILDYQDMQPGGHEASFSRMPEHINIPARTATAHQKLLDKLHGDTLSSFFERNNHITGSGETKFGVISSGVAHTYLKEILSTYNLDSKLTVLELGLIYPFPEKDVLDFLNNGFEKILVLEELDPIIENAVRALAQKNKINSEILGKGFESIAPTGEFTLEQIRACIESFCETTCKSPEPLEDMGIVTDGLPPRPPALCAGCPHRATFYALKLAVPRENSELVMCGDIGCFGLGALPPLKMIDTINHMGMSVSMAQGLSEAFHSSGGNRKTVAMLGDGTFFHSGIASLLNAVYTKANILVIIFDNRTIAMTGGQDHPGASQHKQKYYEIQIEPLVRGMGIPVETISPFDLKDTFKKIRKGVEAEGVSVIISKAPCIFVPDFTKTQTRQRVVVDQNKCNTCANHADLNISCSRKQSPLISLSRAKAKIEASVSINALHQSCPANICNHGFFNSILEGDHKTAVDIVRDKMLFARSCGDICHRPCELFAGSKDEIVPIKQLKKYVSSIEENFIDFSAAKMRVISAEKKDKKVAVVGGGPAGLSAAYDLIQNGYDVAVFEKEKQVGGLVKFAIPDFRMDKKGFDYEAGILAEIGVTFNFGQELGKDFTVDQLSGEYDAVLLAIGMSKPKILHIIEENIPAEKRSYSLEFLKAFNTNETNLPGGSTVLVIGGGNSALDAARSAKHLDESNEVILSCIEKKEDMLAFEEEIEDAIEEGIELIPDSYVKACSANGSLQFELNSFTQKEELQTLSVDHVIVAIGQDTEIEALGTMQLDDANRIASDNKTGRTDQPNVFVAGDLCSGNHMSVIGAIASGKLAANGIRQLLEDYKYEYEGFEALDMLNNKQPEGHLTMKTELSDDLLQKITHFNLFQACQKCNHCIDNFGCPALVKVNGKVNLDETKCTHCGLCIDVCPNDAIRWASEKELETV